MKTASRQNAGIAIEEINYTDLVSGVAVDLFTKLPNGVVPTALSVLIVVPFDTGTTDVLDIGNASVANAYANDIDLTAAAGTRVAATTLPSLINTADGGLQLQVTKTAVGTAPTEGQALVILEYGVLGVEHYTHG